ncbi:MAG: hypothetical protein ACP5IJ_02680 [Candidatus Nanoarchaeia archaeon]
MKSKILPLVSLVLFLAFAFFVIGPAPTQALQFSSNSISLCATDTAVFVTTLTNNASYQDSFTVSLSGEGAKWAVAAPTGITLKPGQSEQLYIYVTPSIAALPGKYDVVVTVTGFSKIETGQFSINVLDCHSAELSSQQVSAEICSATTAKYELTLRNTGKYAENFKIFVDGKPKAWTTLSQELFSLNPNQTATFSVDVTPPTDQTGAFKLTVTAASQNSRATASKELTLNSKPCYDFAVKPETNYLSFCEASEVKIPLIIENKGTIANSFSISVTGPSWAKIENSDLEIGPGQSKSTNIVLYPGYGIIGDYKIVVKVSPKVGTPQEQAITVLSTSCYSADLKLSSKEEKMCPNTERIYTVSLKNTGKFTTKYALSVSGADFVTLEKSFIELNANQSEEVNLFVKPLMEEGVKNIKVTAIAQDPSKVTVSDDLKLEVIPSAECYDVEITSALTKVEVVPGEPALVPIVINNKGLENVSYEFELSGDGAKFVQLNPAALTLPAKSAKTVYAYVSVPEGTSKKSYTVSISARMKGNPKVISTTTFEISIEKTEKVQTPQISMEPQTIAIRESLTQFVKSIGNALQNFKEKLTKSTKQLVKAKVIESNKSVEISNESNESGKKLSTNISNITKYLSPEAAKKLQNASSENKSIVEPKIELTGAKEAREKVIAALLPIKSILTTTVYYVPNWVWVLSIILLLAALSYLLKRKDLLEKFSKFLEEEPKEEQELGKEKLENKEDKGPTAQELLDETKDETKEPEENEKKKLKRKKNSKQTEME